MPKYKHVLLSGGSGKRLWPLSRENFPKPYLTLDKNTPTLFQQTLLRHPNCTEHIIITNQYLYYQSLYQEQATTLNAPTSYLLESTGKNTGPAILLAALYANPDDILVITPADHLISPLNAYTKTIEKACELAQSSNCITLIGITPTFASPDFGYIQTENNTVQAFKEKPSKDIAETYIKDGNCLWNSGIFCFKASIVKELFKTLYPNQFDLILNAYNNKPNTNIIDFSSINSLSFDKGILEKTDQLRVIRNTFEWNDLGSFDALTSTIPTTQTININANNTSAISTEKKTIAFHDVDNIYVIDTDDSILIGKKDRSTNVSKVAEKISEKKPTLLKHSNTVYRPWGAYSILYEQASAYKVKKIVIYPHSRLSLQTHKHRSEHWTCVDGQLTVVNGTKTHTIKPNESIYIEKETPHRIENQSDNIGVIIEIQYGNYLGEDDIIRIESDY
jgi:mannose-1-phosphate guanylyltransferase